MAMGRSNEEQQPLFVASGSLAKGPGHPFYERLNRELKEAGFDRFVEERCAGFYAGSVGRPGTPPGVYFRLLLVGYFEGLDSERGIAWRCADSLALRSFLGYALDQSPPDHSTISRTRRLIDVEAHREVFGFVVSLLAEKGLVKGQTVGIDASTLEANAALRSIVRRETGETYESFLDGLAKASGIATPSREDRAKVDKKRKKKGSNDDWTHPHDPDAKITKMKDGRTHLGHKAEHAVDLEGGAVLAVTVQPADRGDSESIYETLMEACDHVKVALPESDGIEEVVLDKGYHCNAVLSTLSAVGIRSYASEPRRGRRRWKGKGPEQRAVYGNRRRVKGDRGKALLARRGELVERSFAHTLVTGRMRRAHLRGHDNITKRYLLHVTAANLGLLMRSLIGAGTPKGLLGRLAATCARLGELYHLIRGPRAIVERIERALDHFTGINSKRPALGHAA